MGEAVGAGAADGEEVAFGEFEVAFVGEEVAALADGADDVPKCLLAGAVPCLLHAVPGVVEGGADEVVHGGVHHGKLAFAGGFQVFDAG